MLRALKYILILSGLLAPLYILAQSVQPPDSSVDPLTRFSARWIDNERRVELFWIFGNTDLYYGFEVQRRSSTDPTWKPLGTVETGQCQTCLLFYSFQDHIFQNDSYVYRLEMLRINGNREYSDNLQVVVGPPKQYVLNQNYPNPFNNRTSIPYWLARPANVTLTIYNIRGQQIRVLLDAFQHDGFHQTAWDGRDERGLPAASGMYFYRLRIDGNVVDSRRMLFLK